MKKVFLSLLALATFGFANAQSREKETIEITPTVGSSSSLIYGDNTDNYIDMPGVRFGVTADYYFNSRWSIRTGIINESMGARELDFKYKLNYVTVPINANWHFGSTRKWNLNFGLTPSILTSAKEDNYFINEHNNDIKYAFNSFQLGLTYGIGYKIEISEKFGILIDFQGFNGLTNINSKGRYYNQNAVSSFNLGGVFKL